MFLMHAAKNISARQEVKVPMRTNPIHVNSGCIVLQDLDMEKKHNKLRWDDES